MKEKHPKIQGRRLRLIERKRHVLSAELPLELYSELKRRAALEQRSVSQFLIVLLSTHFAKDV